MMRRPGHGSEAGVVRYVFRWPPANRSGFNLYAPPTAVPYSWHHVVGQEKEGRLVLYVDGQPCGSTQTDAAPGSTPCSVQFGALRYQPGDNLSRLERVFSGRLAEIAIYDRLLTLEEIQQHAALGGRRPVGGPR